MFSMFGHVQLSPLHMHFIMWNIFLNFYLTHFEKYNTGVMFLPWAYDFTMWGVTITLFLTWALGAEVWQHQLPYGVSCGRFFEVFLYVSGILSSHPFIVHNIYK